MKRSKTNFFLLENVEQAYMISNILNDIEKELNKEEKIIRTLMEKVEQERKNPEYKYKTPSEFELDLYMQNIDLYEVQDSLSHLYRNIDKMKSIDLDKAVKLSAYFVEVLDEVSEDDLKDDLHHGFYIFGENVLKEEIFEKGEDSKLSLTDDMISNVKKYAKKIAHSIYDWDDDEFKNDVNKKIKLMVLKKCSNLIKELE